MPPVLISGSPEYLRLLFSGIHDEKIEAELHGLKLLIDQLMDKLVKQEIREVECDSEQTEFVEDASIGAGSEDLELEAQVQAIQRRADARPTNAACRGHSPTGGQGNGETKTHEAQSGVSEIGEILSAGIEVAEIAAPKAEPDTDASFGVGCADLGQTQVQARQLTSRASDISEIDPEEFEVAENIAPQAELDKGASSGAGCADASIGAGCADLGQAQVQARQLTSGASNISEIDAEGIEVAELRKLRPKPCLIKKSAVLTSSQAMEGSQQAADQLVCNERNDREVEEILDEEDRNRQLRGQTNPGLGPSTEMEEKAQRFVLCHKCLAPKMLKTIRCDCCGVEQVK